MTPEERRAKLREIVDEHDRAFEALHDADDAFDLAGEDLVGAVRAIARAVEAQRAAGRAHRRAIDCALKANQAALALFNEDRG